MNHSLLSCVTAPRSACDNGGPSRRVGEATRPSQSVRSGRSKSWIWQEVALQDRSAIKQMAAYGCSLRRSTSVARGYLDS